MRNDYPEENSGILTAWKFALPLDSEMMFEGGTNQLAHSWSNVMIGDARQYKVWVTRQEFEKLLQAPPYDPLLRAVDWEPAWELCFNAIGDEVSQAVRVSTIENGAEKRRTYTFFLKKVQRGPYKDCWMTTGVHTGHVDKW